MAPTRGKCVFLSQAKVPARVRAHSVKSSRVEFPRISLVCLPLGCCPLCKFQDGPTDRFPGGWRQTPPPPKRGCSPWRPAGDLGAARDQIYTLSRNVEAPVGQKKQRPVENNCPHRLTSCKDYCPLSRDSTFSPPLTFSSSSFVVPATSSRRNASHRCPPRTLHKPSISSQSELVPS